MKYPSTYIQNSREYKISFFKYPKMEACMKKFLLLAAVATMFGVSSVQAEKGGVVPCLATCFMGDARIGLYMNEGNPIETDDWIVLVGNIVGLGWVYGGYKAYEKAQTGSSFCVGAIWGRRAGSEFKSTKLRTKEVLMCIPCVNIYPCIAIPLEAFNGKTMSQVVQEEGLSR
jgi:hypothetical protein